MPRATIFLLIAFVLFIAISMLYVLPTLLEPPPPGAIADYTRERVIARMEGKVMIFATIAVVVSGAFAAWRNRTS